VSKELTIVQQPAEAAEHRGTLEQYSGAEARAFVIETQEQADIAAELLNDVKRRRQALEAAQRRLLEPMREAEARVRDLFRPALEAAGEADKLWRGKILESNRRRAEEASRALAEASRAAREGDQAAAAAAMARAQPVERVAGATIRRVWKYRVTDEVQVPRDYLTIDTAKLQRAAKDHPEVPGVEFYQEEILAATG